MNLNRKNVEIIADELERQIEKGILKPGEKLESIEKLAERYRVGRSTIREALSRLKAKGMVESRQGGGTYVTHLRLSLPDYGNGGIILGNPAELKSLLQVRRIVETGCAELAAQYRSEQDVREMEKLIAQMKEAVGNEEISQIYDVHFHLAIARSTQNPFLLQMMETISSAMRRTIRDSRKLWLYSEKETAERLFEEHQAIFTAIRSQDAPLAAKLMRGHLDKVAGVLYDEWGS